MPPSMLVAVEVCVIRQVLLGVDVRLALRRHVTLTDAVQVHGPVTERLPAPVVV